MDLLANEFDPVRTVEFDQGIALTWRDDEVHALERESKLKPAPWMGPNTEGGRFHCIDRVLRFLQN